MSEPPPPPDPLPSPAPPPPAVLETVPEAGLAPRRTRLGWYWLLPLLTLAIVAGVLGVAWSRSGVRITLRFLEGHGLKPGDATFRGGRLGDLKIEGDNILLGQPFLFTKENIDQFDF